MSKINKVGVWPVGLVGGLNAEAPVVENGKSNKIFPNVIT